jgi:Raf kinase inhibitor-like YbhB/YbcL family protein
MPTTYAKLYLLLLAALLLCACKSEAPSNVASSNTKPTGGPSMQLKITSPAFDDGGMIPRQYTCDGPNISPPLAWDAIPNGAKSLVLIVDDPDAPARTWVHWIAFNLPAPSRGLPENVPPQESIPGGGRQGTNDFHKIGYGGPCPPSGTHRYFFHLYALDTAELAGLDSTATKDQLLKAMQGHLLAEGQLMGRYKR